MVQVSRTMRGFRVSKKARVPPLSANPYVNLVLGEIWPSNELDLTFDEARDLTKSLSSYLGAYAEEEDERRKVEVAYMEEQVKKLQEKIAAVKNGVA